VKIAKWVAGIVVGLLAFLFVVGLCLPRRFRVERTVLIGSAPDRVHRLVNRFEEWPTWTAWTKERYPDMEVTFSGPAEGVGSKYHWTGSESGTGDIEITASDPKRGIEYDLAFDNGAMLSTGAVAYEPEGEGTRVKWHAEGDLGWNPISRYFGLLMDGMMGPDLEKGLANLKARVEADADKPGESAEPAPLPESPPESDKQRE
jgi:hypothetical protein